MLRRARSAAAMPLNELLISAANASVVVFVVSSTLSVGLALTVPQILTPLRNVRLVLLSLLANFVLAPIVAIGLARVLGLDAPLGIGLLLVGLAGGAPFLLKLADLAKADMPFAVGLMVVLMVITVGYMPIVLPLALDGVSVNPVSIARSLIVLMLIPLAVGLALRAWHPPTAGRVRRFVAPVSSISMIFVVVLTTAGHLGSMMTILGSLGIFAAVIFVAICFGIGWVLGGPGADTRGVLSLGTAQRNTAAALVVAGQNFSDAKVVVMITVVMIVSFVVLMPLARVLARRHQPVDMPASATAA
jgi:BASS family bile acid:Na+ symporter